MATNQSSFLKGIFILESVVLAHEVVHSVHSSKKTGAILKLDNEKVYDRVSWELLLRFYLQEALVLFG